MLRILKKYLLRDIYDRLNNSETVLTALLDNPSYKDGDAIGFNGQKGKKQIFSDLLKNYNFACIIETGTYLGDTTGYLANSSNLPVYSCELIPLFYSMAKKRLIKISSISLRNMDSRAFLKELSSRHEIIHQECFFYLDAHWNRNLPLRKEISIIASYWKKYIIMIDDFQVPGDPGYGYERSGCLKKANISYIRPVLRKYNLSVFFPGLPSSEESGARSGSIVLSKNDDYAAPLKKLPSLKYYQ